MLLNYFTHNWMGYIYWVYSRINGQIFIIHLLKIDLKLSMYTIIKVDKPTNKF